VTSLSASPLSENYSTNGLRPVNLRTDLRPLADLIELVFADSMEDGGRAAIREMRYLSKIGYGLNLISRLNELALGISLGYVFIADGKLVGNVSIYPAGYPKEMGESWIIANVGVHPEYQRRGIAHQLVEASTNMIRERGGKRAILQVNYDNVGAQRLYERMGFIYERAWTMWRRSSFIQSPPSHNHNFHITRLRPSEWQAEYALAQQVRSNNQGGLGWLMPLHKKYFHTSLWKQFLNFFSLNNTEKLIIRDEINQQILASLWIENSMSIMNIRIRLMTAPHIEQKPYVNALLNHVLQRFGRATILLEHPHDDTVVNELLTHYQFRAKRDLWHMRLDF
jgi:ribosomal protein S18 acetylase RimI-like enzyme